MEEEKQTGVIYVGKDDGIMEIVDKIKNTPAQFITLEVPQDSAIFQDITNLKILQKKSEEIGKDVSISKSDVGSLYGMPERKSPSFSPTSVPSVSNLPACEFLPIKPAGKTSSVLPQVKRISDMVNKNETVDLRRLALEKNNKSNGGEAYAVQGVLKDDNLIQDQGNLNNFPFRSQKENDAFKMERMESASREEFEEPAEKSFKEDSFLPMSETDTDGENEPEKEKSEEGYWKSLAENKASKESGNDGMVKGLFDKHSRLNMENENAKNMDFSYPYEKSKKKKFSILPAVSAQFFAVFILICIATASLSLFFLLPKADIAIALKKENVEGDFALNLDEDITTADVAGGRIPAQKTEITNEQSQTFNTTSKKRVSEKAAGQIVILNECSTGPQTLIAGTRFLSKDGSKVFKIEEGVSIPGFTKPEDNTVPGEKIVRVIAENPGEEYNIKATSFTIPKLQELASWKYSCLYARSDKPMAGGLDKEVTYVSQADYDKAVQALTELARKANDDKIAEKQEGGDSIYINDEDQKDEPKAASSVPVNGVADKFELKLTAKRSVLAISRKDLETIVQSKILSQSNLENAKPVDGSLSYEIGDITNKDGQIAFNVSAKEEFTFEINPDKLKAEISGKDRQELTDYFSKMNGVKSVSVNFWPFWVNKTPNSADKINIILQN